jgi:low affinity Fe/Cu permease
MTKKKTIKKDKIKKGFFDRFANKAASFTGSSPAFIAAVLIIILWAITGPLFDYSETWQLVINTGTTIITFLMVFLIQKAQNKDSKAIQLKLNELIAASDKASNRMVDIEDLTEEELDELHKYYTLISQLAEKERDIHQSHSIDAAEDLHKRKKARHIIEKPSDDKDKNKSTKSS